MDDEKKQICEWLKSWVEELSELESKAADDKAYAGAEIFQVRKNTIETVISGIKSGTYNTGGCNNGEI